MVAYMLRLNAYMLICLYDYMLICLYAYIYGCLYASNLTLPTNQFQYLCGLNDFQ